MIDPLTVTPTLRLVRMFKSVPSLSKFATLPNRYISYIYWE